MGHQLDILLVNPPGKEQVYQSLSADLVALEPPVWAGLIAQYVRTRGVGVNILDAEALGLSYAECARAILDANATLTVAIARCGVTSPTSTATALLGA